MKKGFTMIELIFVIVILGILASVAIPRLAGTRADAEISTAVANLRTLVSDASAYYVAKGEFAIGADGVKWNEITNVPLTNADKPAVGAVSYLTIDGQRCIGLELNNRLSAVVPARITFSKIGTNQSGVCKQVLDAEPVKAYFNSKAGPLPSAIPIGSSISIYGATAAKPAPTKPVASKPVASKPVAAKPVAAKPVAAKPTPAKPWVVGIVSPATPGSPVATASVVFSGSKPTVPAAPIIGSQGYFSTANGKGQVTQGTGTGSTGYALPAWFRR